MVFVWSNLVDGEPHFTLSQVALNDVIMVVAFAPLVALLLGLSSITVPWDTLLLSVALYIVVPCSAPPATAYGPAFWQRRPASYRVARHCCSAWFSIGVDQCPPCCSPARLQPHRSWQCCCLRRHHGQKRFRVPELLTNSQNLVALWYDISFQQSVV